MGWDMVLQKEMAMTMMMTTMLVLILMLVPMLMLMMVVLNVDKGLSQNCSSAVQLNISVQTNQTAAPHSHCPYPMVQVQGAWTRHWLGNG
jgi:cell division protein FtsX